MKALQENFLSKEICRVVRCRAERENSQKADAEKQAQPICKIHGWRTLQGLTKDCGTQVFTQPPSSIGDNSSLEGASGWSNATDKPKAQPMIS